MPIRTVQRVIVRVAFRFVRRAYRNNPFSPWNDVDEDDVVRGEAKRRD